MDKRSEQIKKIIEIFESKGFIKNNFDDYENTKSSISFTCDKGHDCLTKVRYILYDDVGCKTCQYENKKSILNIELTETVFKICNSCNEKKYRYCYGKLASSIDGLRPTCKLCRRKKHLSKCNDSDFRKMREEKSLKYFKNNPFKSLYSRCLSSTNKKGFTEFNIDADFLEELFIRQSGKCYWSGIKMCKDSVGLGKLNTISVDRIDCNIGYTKSNVVLACKFINLGRGNTDKDIFKSFLLENFKINNLLG